MKNKIFCFVLCLVLLFSVFSSFAFAAGVDSLTAEIEQNFPDVELEDYTSNGSPAFIGMNEHGCAEEGMYLKFSIYVYLPGFNKVTSSWLDFVCNAYNSNGELVHTEKSDFHVGYCKAESGNGFYRFDFNLPKKMADSEGYRTYEISKIGINGTDAENKSTVQIFVLDIFYKMSFNSDGTYDVEYSVSEVVTLDIKATDYRTRSTDEKYKYDNVASIYFSIPDKYQDWYDYLYSVSVAMRKKLTNPIFVSNLFPEGNSESSIGGFSSPEEYSTWINRILKECYIYTDSLEYIKNGFTGEPEAVLIGSEYFYKIPASLILDDGDLVLNSKSAATFPLEVESFPIVLCDPDADSFYDIFIFGEDLESYVKNYKGDEDLFASSEYIPFSTKTIEQTWESLDYSASAGFWDYWEDYGSGTAFKYLFLKHKPEDLTNFFEELGIEPDGYNFKDEPYLIKIDEGVMKHLNELEPEAFCDKYAIGYNDYDEFKSYCQTLSNVVLYRVDVDYYLSMPVKVSTQEAAELGGLIVSDISDGSAGIVETYVYEDVNVVDITMYREGTYTSLKTSSNFVNIYPDIEGIIPEDGLPDNETIIHGIGLYLVEKIKEFVGIGGDNDPPEWFKILLSVISSILIVIAVLVVIKIVFIVVDLIRLIIPKRKKKE